MNENTFKFLTDRGLEQYDAFIKEYMENTYAKKGEAGDSVFVKVDFTSVGNNLISILRLHDSILDWTIQVEWTKSDEGEITITNCILIHCSDQDAKIIEYTFATNKSLELKLDSIEYGGVATTVLNRFFLDYNGTADIVMPIGTDSIEWNKINKIGSLDITPVQAKEYMESGKIPMAIIQESNVYSPIYCLVALDEFAYFEIPLNNAISENTKSLCMLTENELYMQVIVNNNEPTEDVEFLKNITYQELKDLRDSEQLIPGMQYCITDYECTTSNPNTRGANSNKFDIIVTADSIDTLNENARVSLHDFSDMYTFVKTETTLEGYVNGIMVFSLEKNLDGITSGMNGYTVYGGGSIILLVPDSGDITMETILIAEISADGKAYSSGETFYEYLIENSDFPNYSAWEIKYCLDNDKTRFAWAIDGIQPSPTLTTFLYWEDEEGNEYVYTGYDASDPAYIEWWDENAPAAEEEEIPRRGVRASSPHVFTGPVASYNEAVYDSNELNSKVGKIKQMKVPEQPSKAFLTWRYIDDYGKEQYSTFYECKIVDKEGYIVWFKGDHPKYGEVFTTKNPLKYYGKDIPDSLVYEAKDLKTKIGEITGYSLPSNKKGTIEWKDGEEKTRTYNSYYTYTTSESKSVIAWTGENVEDEDDLGPNTIYTYNPPTDYSEQDPEASGYIYSSDSLDDRSRLRAPSSIGIITEFELIDNAEDTRSLRETAEPAEPIEPTEPTYITGKGVIYYMKDEFGNECPYDFKNIQYYVNEKWVYTFDEGGKDYSLVGKCFNNIIKEYKTNDGLTLDFNFILFTGVCYSNEFCFGCNTISISSECASNRFYEGCNYITLGKGCTFNTFEKSCKSIKLDSSNSYIHAFEGVSNISTPDGVYNAQIYPFTHITNGITILDKNNTKQVQFVGMNVKCDSGQIADGWPYRIRYTIEKYTGIDLILKPPKPCAYYSCEKLDSLTILTGSDNMDNFKVEFTVPERGCNISLPSGSTYIGSLSVTAGKRYLLTHDDYGMYYIGEINIA